jgi:hypothetical protein
MKEFYDAWNMGLSEDDGEPRAVKKKGWRS